MLKTDVNKRNETVVKDEAPGSDAHQKAQLVANDTVVGARGLRLRYDKVPAQLAKLAGKRILRDKTWT